MPAKMFARMPLTADNFRDLALSLPRAIESSHMNHPDFRVDGRIFASLDSPRHGFAMVTLTPVQQGEFVKAHPRMFMPVKGGWGVKGATNVELRFATKTAVREALLTAWTNKARE